LIKVSKDSDSRLVFIENLSEILLSSGWDQVRYQQPKNGQKPPTLHMTPLTKSPKTIFFPLRTQRLTKSWGFEQLSCAIGWGAMRLESQPKYPWFFSDFQGRYICRPVANVLRAVFFWNIFVICPIIV